MRACSSPVPVSQALQDRGGCLASASDGVERRLDRPLRVVEPPGKLVAVIADDLGAVFGQQPAETDGLDQGGAILAHLPDYLNTGGLPLT